MGWEPSPILITEIKQSKIPLTGSKYVLHWEGLPTSVTSWLLTPPKMAVGEVGVTHPQPDKDNLLPPCLQHKDSQDVVVSIKRHSFSVTVSNH